MPNTRVLVVSVSLLFHLACDAEPGPELAAAPSPGGFVEIGSFSAELVLDADGVPRSTQLIKIGTGLDRVEMVFSNRSTSPAVCGAAATFCVTTTLTSHFDSEELRGVVVEIDTVSPVSSVAHSDDTKPAYLPAAASDANGMWIYGHLEPGESAARQWKFNSTTGKVAITGKILADVVLGGSLTETACADDATSDGDGRVDCGDADCSISPDCQALRHQWTFTGDATDRVGSAEGQLLGGASVTGGQLTLDGVNDYMRSADFSTAIGARTLVAWVSPANTAQRSGSVLTIERTTGADVFDAIVYAERTAGQWMSGSNNFLRSVVNNGGGAESVVSPAVVMLAITYDAANQIVLYRNGAVYASAASASQGTLESYSSGARDFLIGLRHLDLAGSVGQLDGNDAWWAGSVEEARVYDTALTAAQVATLFAAGPKAD